MAPNSNEIELLGYLLDPPCFIIGTRDAEYAPSGVSQPYTFQAISSVDTPEEKGGENLASQVDDTDLAEYVDALSSALREHFVGGRGAELDPAIAKHLYQRWLEPSIGVPYEETLSGVYVGRASSKVDDQEADGQFDRAYETIYRMLETGFVPKFLMGEIWTGTEMVRPAVRQLLARAQRGEVDAVFIHTLDRFSRAELDGLLLLVLIHQLVGNVFYVSATTRTGVEFDHSDRRSMLLAGEEVMAGAIDGDKVAQRLQTGKLGRIRRLKSHPTHFGGRLYHVANPDVIERNRPQPMATAWTRTNYRLEAEAILATGREETLSGIAWLNRRSNVRQVHEMTSDWIEGRPVPQRLESQKSARVRTKSPVPLLRPLESAVVAHGDQLAELRRRVRALTPAIQQPKRGPYDAYAELEAYAKVFSDFARHMATGHVTEDPDNPKHVKIVEPGSDPLHCAVTGCNSTAIVRQIRRATELKWEAVCRLQANHRWDPLKPAIIRRATEASSAFCPWCGSMDTAVGQSVSVGTDVAGFPLFCEHCEEYALLPSPFNPAHRAQLIASNSLVSFLDAQLCQNGWPARHAFARPIPGPKEKEVITARQLEESRIDHKLAERDAPRIFGVRGPRMELENRRLRYRIWEDVVNGIYPGAHFYVEYAMEMLGLDEHTAQANVAYHVKYFRSHGFADVLRSNVADRTIERAYATAMLEQDFQANLIHDHNDNIQRIQGQFPELKGKAATMIYFRALESFRGGKFDSFVKGTTNPRLEEKKFLRPRIQAYLDRGEEPDRPSLRRELAKAFPDYHGRAASSLIQKLVKRMQKEHRGETVRNRGQRH